MPATLEGVTASGPTWEMAGGGSSSRSSAGALPDDRGRDISVELEPGVLEHDATGFVLGTAFGILLHQRGALVLHGRWWLRWARIAICGESGAGKSTLAAALCREDFSFVTDDMRHRAERPAPPWCWLMGGD